MLSFPVLSGTAPQRGLFLQQQPANTGKISHKAGVVFRDGDLIFCQQHKAVITIMNVCSHKAQKLVGESQQRPCPSTKHY